MTDKLVFIPISKVITSWPEELIPMPSAIDMIGLKDGQVTQSGSSKELQGTLVLIGDLVINIPFIPGLSIAFLPGAGLTEIGFDVELDLDGFTLGLNNLGVAIRFDSKLLKKADKISGEWQPVEGPVEIAMAGASVHVNEKGDFDFEVDTSLDITPFMIGETGVVIVIPPGGIGLILSDKAAIENNIPDNPDGVTRGVLINEATIYLPEGLSNILPDSVAFNDFFIGGGGVTGKISGNWTVNVKKNTDETYYLVDEDNETLDKFLGLDIALEKFGLEFKQNAIVGSEIKGVMILPFFDAPISIDINIGMGGTIGITLSAKKLTKDSTGGVISGVSVADDESIPPAEDETPPIAEEGDVENDDVPDQGPPGLLVLEKEGLFKLKVYSFAVEKTGDVYKFIISGSIQPLIGGDEFEWPAIEVDTLSIDTEGKLSFDGGWMDMSAIEALEFHGFSVDIDKFGFGKEETGDNWIGFSGGIYFINGMEIGGSVEGLKIIWSDTGAEPVRVQVSGIGIMFTIPDTLTFVGSVAFIDEPDEKGFKGRAKLTLDAMDMVVDSQILITRVGNETSLFIYLDLQLPFGIPLAQTGLAIFGFAGLFAMNRLPGKTSDQEWYGDPTEPGWYLSEPVGVAQMDKWDFSPKSFAFGAGVTIGTMPDGSAFAAKVLLALLIPGPIILIEGKAQFMAKRTKLSEGSAAGFRTLAVIDLAANFILFNIEAMYMSPADGSTIDISGGAEAFFDLMDLSNSHLYLGEEPTEKRIRATIVSLFEANAYLTIDRTGLKTGAWIGYVSSWDFVVVSLTMEAWIEFSAILSLKPVQLAAGVELYGNIALLVCGIELSMSIKANIDLETPKPFLVRAALEIIVTLPKPLPSPEVDVELLWQKPAVPAIPIPLSSIAIEHFKVSEKWVLDVSPIAESSTEAGFYDESASSASFPRLEDGPFGITPIVPLDARITLTFARPMNDVNKYGDNATTIPDDDWIGNYKMRYKLAKVTLEKKPLDDDSLDWEPVPDDYEYGYELFGKWQLNEAGDPNNTGLILGALSPFENARETIDIAGWIQAITGSLDQFPGNYNTDPVKVCVDFEEDEPGTKRFPVFSQDRVVFVSNYSATVIKHKTRGTRKRRGLKYDGDPEYQGTVAVYIPEPAAEIHMEIIPGTTKVVVEGFNDGKVIDKSEVIKSSVGRRYVSLSASGNHALEWVKLSGNDFALVSVCYITTAAKALAETQVDRIDNLAMNTPVHWQQSMQLFEPETRYRVSVQTEATRTKPNGEEENFVFDQFAYFETAKPPGFYPLESAVGDGVDSDEDDSTDGEVKNSIEQEIYPLGALKDLDKYVSSTVPGMGEQYHYCSYDIRFEFNESYIERMYDMAGLALVLELRSDDGEALSDLSGNYYEMSIDWNKSPVTSGSLVLTQYASLLNNSGVLSDLSIDLLPPNDKIIGIMPEQATMLPGTTYTANIRAAENIVYSTKFISSQFKNFTHHIQSYRDIVWDHFEILNEPDQTLIAPDDLNELSVQIQSIDSSMICQSEEVFENISTLLNLGFRNLPQILEITHLRDSIHNYGLLIESPEPIDWQRVDFDLFEITSEPNTTTMVNGPLKIINAVIDPEGRDKPGEYNLEWIELLVLEDLDLTGFQIQDLSKPGTDQESYHRYYEFEKNSRYSSGTILRIHSGANPAVDVSDPPGVIHLYVAKQGQKGKWRLNNSGDTVRIIDKNKTNIHWRCFTKEPANRNLENRLIVASKDGTRAFIFRLLDDNSLVDLVMGIYELDISFQLDLGNDLPVLSRSGDTSVETTTLTLNLTSESH